ncbi:hypothetical protein G6F68_021069 [Rhizopus microsporus]|nr:hypothetical protein G6F68_021069 [Rhizopus microsporus]
MSPEFQQTLDGHAYIQSPVDIAYESKVFIRHIATRGGYLHSHPHNYPGGSKRRLTEMNTAGDAYVLYN